MGTSVPPPGFTSSSTPAPALAPAAAPRPARPKVLAGIAAALVVGVAAFVLLGSGGGGVSGPIAQAATLSSRTAGYRIHVSVQASSSAGTPMSMRATANGVVDLRNRTTAMTMNMDLGQSPLIQQIGTSSLRFQLLEQGTKFYIKLPSALPTLGGRWIAADLSKLSKLSGLSSLTGNPTMSDPSRMLDDLKSVSESVVSLGSERIGASTTTHYRAELSVARLAGGLGAAGSAGQQAASALEQAISGGQVPVDVWIDTAHLVRRIALNLTLDLPSGQSMQETVRADLGHYGPQPLLQAPDQSAVTDLSNLPGLGG